MPTTYPLVPVYSRLPPITALYPCEVVLNQVPPTGQEFTVQRYVRLNNEGQGSWRDCTTDIRVADFVLNESHWHVLKFNAQMIAGKFVPHRIILGPSRPVLAPSGEIASVANLQLVIKRLSQADLVLTPTITATSHKRTASEFTLTWTNASNPGLTAKAYVSDYNLPLKAVRIRFQLTFTQALTGLNISEITLRWNASVYPWGLPLGFIKNASRLRYQSVSRSTYTELRVWKAYPSADPGASLRYNYRNLQRLLPMTYGPYLQTPSEWDSGAWLTAVTAMRTVQSAANMELTSAAFPIPDDTWRLDSLGIPSVDWLGLRLKLDGWLLWPAVQSAVGFSTVDPSVESTNWQSLIDQDPWFCEALELDLPKLTSNISEMFRQTDEYLIDEIGYTDILYGEIPQQIRGNESAESTFRGHLYRSHSVQHYNVGQAAGNFALQTADPYARKICLAVAHHAQQLCIDGVTHLLDHGKEVLPYETETNFGHSTNISGLLYAYLLGDHHALDSFNSVAETMYDNNVGYAAGTQMRETTVGISSIETIIDSATTLTAAQRAFVEGVRDARVATLVGQLAALVPDDQWGFNPELFFSSSFSDSIFPTLYTRLLAQETIYMASGLPYTLPVAIRAFTHTRDKTYLTRMAHCAWQYLFQTYSTAPFDAATIGISSDDGRIGCWIEKLDTALKEAGLTETEWLEAALYEPGMYPQKYSGQGTYDPAAADDSPLYFYAASAGTYNLTVLGEVHLGYVFLDPAGIQTNFSPSTTTRAYRPSGLYRYVRTISVTVTTPGLCTLKTVATFYRNLWVSVSQFPEGKLLRPGSDYWTFLSAGVFIARDGSRPKITIRGWYATDQDNKTYGTHIRDYRQELGFVRGEAQSMTIDFTNYPSYERAYLELYTQGGGRCLMTVDRECLFLPDSKRNLSYPDSTYTATKLWSLIP